MVNAATNRSHDHKYIVTLEDGIAKATKREMTEREDDILDMLSQGFNKSTICIDLAKKYNVSERTIETQYYNVYNSLNTDFLQKRHEVAAVVYTRKDLIYRKCMEERKYKTALDAVVAIGKMAKLYEGEMLEQKLPDVVNLSSRDFSAPLKVVGENDDESSGES